MAIRVAINRAAMTPVVLVISFIVLAGVSVGLIETVQRAQRTYIADHLQANLKSTVDYIQLVERDQITQVSVIANNKVFMSLASATLAHPSDAGAKAALEDWLAGFYSNSALRSYALLAADGTIRASTLRDREGKPPPQRQVFLDLLNQLQRDDTAMTPLIDIIAPNSIAPVGALFQVTCSNIRPGDNSIGYFCLLSPASLRLFDVLKVARTGKTGEAYIIDTDARIKSPSRFIEQPVLRAQVPISSSPDFTINNASVREGALTQVAKVLLKDKRKQTGYLENYRDYRGVPVVGVGQWLDDLGVGVIVEEDVSEAFYAYRVSSWAITALTGFALALMSFLFILQNRARRRLVESELRGRVFRDNSPNGVLLQDMQGTLLMMNPVPGQLFGWKKADGVGKALAELLPAELVKLLSDAQRQIAKGEHLVKQTYAHVDAAGTARTLRVASFPVRNGDQQIGIGSLLSDITLEQRAQKILEDMNHELEIRVDERTRELLTARDKAEAAMRAKAAFLANMSHEIRTPLNAILGMAYLAQHQNTDQQIEQYLSRIDTSGHHLLGVVNDILDFSKLEAGKFTVVHEVFSLSRLLQRSIEFVAEQATSKGLDLSIHIEPNIPDELAGDAQHIVQILINFVSNAVKFTEQGAVMIRATRIASEGNTLRLRFAVQDTGAGISEEQLAYLFQPFEQLDMSTTRQNGGTGLGLAISSRLAQLLGGEVGVVSSLGKGSTFFVELPLEVGQSDLKTASVSPSSNVGNCNSENVIASSVSRPLFTGQRVLLVEDNPVNREVGVALLKLLGVSVTTAENGAQALEMLSVAKFDLALMDLHMPVMDGLQATLAIRQNSAYAQLPIIALTADVVSANLENLKAAGVNDILSKPIKPDSLHQVLLQWLPFQASEVSNE